MYEYTIAGRSKKELLIGLCLIHFMLGLDINIVSVSMPAFVTHFGISTGEASKVIWIYFLVITCLMLIMGRSGDIRGFRKIYCAGISVFVAGSVLASISFTFDFLLVSRIIQAVGASVLFALTPAVIAGYFAEDSRGKIFGINYSFTALGGITGRILSGFLISEFGWSSVFYLNIPAGLIALFVMMKYLPSDIRFPIKKSFDYTGAILASAGLFLLMLAINTVGSGGWGSREFMIYSGAAILILVIFGFREARTDQPLFSPLILKIRNISYSSAAFVLVYSITNGMIFIVPFYLQWVQLITKQESGLLMAVPSAMQFVFGYFSGRLSDAKGSKVVCTTGLIMIFISIALHYFFTMTTPVIFIIIAIAFYGAAIGFFIPSNTKAIMSDAPRANRGSVSGFMTTSIRIGSALGTVVFSAVFTSFAGTSQSPESDIEREATLEGFRLALVAGLIFAAIALMLISRTESKAVSKINA